MRIHLLIAFSLVLVSGELSYSETEAEVPAGLRRPFELLSKTSLGEQALRKAKENGIPITLGEISKTDITATRKRNGSNETYHYQTKIEIAKDKEAVFQALDLAHELVHANTQKTNPFDPNLTAEDYVQSGIEGTGGEAQAIAEECAVGKEFVENPEIKKQLTGEAVSVIKARCDFAWKTASQESRWNQSFYFLGHYSKEFIAKLQSFVSDATVKQNDLIKKIERKTPMFSSAVARKPYPLALLEEYSEITKLFCKGRAPASAVDAASEGVSARCAPFQNQNQ